jgi:cell division protein ZapA (FtsZ GTPase activity inhibitor)
MADTISTANMQLRSAQRTIEAARTVRAPRGQAATLRTTAGELDQAIDEVKAELDSLSELGETESLRLQMAMDRMSKLMSTLSNILKKASETSGQITQNIK